MNILSNTGGLAETNCYLLIDEATKSAALIDAPESTVAPLLAQAKQDGLTLAYLLLTHGHWDHISDHKAVTDAFPDAKVLISRLEEPRLQAPSGMMFTLPYEIPPRQADGYLEDGQILRVGNLELQVLATPGHAAGHVCLYLPARGAEPGVLFAGDLLMAGSVGRYDLADGDLGTLKASLQKVLALPPETVVLSGHGPVTTIGNELNGNPFIRGRGLA